MRAPAERQRERVAVVTGGGGGLGRAIGCALAERGAHVVLVGRSHARLAAAAEAVAATRAGVDVLVGDVARPEDVARCAHACAAIGEVEILINNAAELGPVGPTWRCDPEAWLRTLAVNCGAAFLWTRAVLPGMLARRRGWIVNVSGGGAAAPRRGVSAYAAAKTALVRLTETVAAEAASAGVRVNALAPGVLPTALLDQLRLAVEDDPSSFAENECAPGAADAVAVAAAAAAFLASCEAGLTGRLVSAVHDPWREWESGEAVPPTPWLGLRRIDRHTLDRVTEAVKE